MSITNTEFYGKHQMEDGAAMDHQRRPSGHPERPASATSASEPEPEPEPGPEVESPFLPDWLFAHAERTPEAPAVASPTARLTYAELASRVQILAGHLAAGGAGPGTRVLVSLPNSPAAVVAGLAVNAVGATSVEVSRAWSVDALREVATRSGVGQVIIGARDAQTWAEALSGLAIDRAWVVNRGALPPGVQDVLSGMPTMLLLEDGQLGPDAGPAHGWVMTDLEPDQPALVLYTSGSTGRPHGVIQTFRNIDANSRSIVTYLGLTSADRALLALPLSYCYGRSVLQTHLLVGGSLFLDGRMAFPRVVLETAAREQCTGFAGVPMTFEIIRRQVDVSTIALPQLRYLTQAGGAMSLDTISWARAAFAPAELIVMYGQTEATARLTYLPPGRADDKPGSVGLPIPGVTLRVVDGSGHDVPVGETGELVARGANVTPGYLDDPGETASILRDGWLWTGDLAARDEDGFIYLKGRAREILKVAGHRISPVELEHVIAQHPDVSEVAVYGIPDEVAGEVPAALIVLASSTRPSDADLRNFCRERLPAYQVPVSFTVADALPRNESGKLMRGELASRIGGPLGAGMDSGQDPSGPQP